MAADSKNPDVGDVVFDGTEFTPYLRDLKPGELQGMRTEQAGFEEVTKEILSNQAEWGEKAGVTANDMAEFTTASSRIARIDRFLQPIRKFVEMLVETRYLLDDRRQKIVFNIAQSVDRRGALTPELFAKYEKTRIYRSAAAKKGLRTRRRNEEQAATMTENGENAG